jgi:hypothetical protein
MMIILAAFFVLIGGVIAAMKWLEVGPFSSEITADAEPTKEPMEEPVYIDMEPLVIQVIQGEQAVSKIQIQIKLQANGKDKAAEIKQLMPKISDLFLIDLYAFIPRLLKETKRIDTAILKARLMLMTEQKLGKGLLQDIFVQSVVDTPIR